MSLSGLHRVNVGPRELARAWAVSDHLPRESGISGTHDGDLVHERRLQRQK